MIKTYEGRILLSDPSDEIVERCRNVLLNKMETVVNGRDCLPIGEPVFSTSPYTGKNITEVERGKKPTHYLCVKQVYETRNGYTYEVGDMSDESCGELAIETDVECEGYRDDHERNHSIIHGGKCIGLVMVDGYASPKPCKHCHSYREEKNTIHDSTTTRWICPATINGLCVECVSEAINDYKRVCPSPATR